MKPCIYKGKCNVQNFKSNFKDANLESTSQNGKSNFNCPKTDRKLANEVSVF